MGNGYGMGFGGIFMWLFWLLVIVGVVWLVKSFVGGDGCAAGKGKSALEILQERYARGEIDQQEFEQKRRDLEQ
ncbi:SHOCT domain-containing protein [Sedimenticola hydrogenitrophicus]|uniref:SHOCT domain-containing protein n=1 Tax=Sedimenticola hydrogenitrophicus TaxID=2967975 RepID=UPI002FFCB778